MARAGAGMRGCGQGGGGSAVGGAGVGMEGGEGWGCREEERRAVNECRSLRSPYHYRNC